MNQQQLQEFINKTSQSGSILGMESIVHLCEELGNPQNQTKVIHIAGTNGKGSTGILLQSALIHCGKKVGRFSSPAVFAYEEMFQIQGENISEERLQTLYERVKNACDRMVAKGYPHPTIFEVETAAAYTYFSEEKCDFSIIEVGMGGRTDATNVVENPAVSVITSISMDHTAFLGDTLEKIANMKAGIIKEGCPVVALAQKEEVQRVLEKEADLKHTEVIYAEPKKAKIQEFSPDGMKICVYPGEEIETILTGYPQIENVCLARTVWKVLEDGGLVPADKKSMLAGFYHAVWQGRFETILWEPRMIIDGAHNEDAAKKLACNIETFFPKKEIRFIAGVLKDKDYPVMLKHVLPYGKAIYCVTPHNPRALQAAELAKEAQKYMGAVTVCEDINQAVDEALKDSKKDDVIVVFGSLSYLAEIKEKVKK